MVCEFILGRRGSGKTEALYDKMMTRLSEQRGKVHLVLPEQATFLHEKRIATLPEIEAFWIWRLLLFAE